MAFFHESEASPFVHIQIRKDILQHVDDAALVMHHLFQGVPEKNNRSKRRGNIFNR
jgi:hypothetical protein